MITKPVLRSQRIFEKYDQHGSRAGYPAHPGRGHDSRYPDPLLLVGAEAAVVVVDATQTGERDSQDVAVGRHGSRTWSWCSRYSAPSPGQRCCCDRSSKRTKLHVIRSAEAVAQLSQRRRGRGAQPRFVDRVGAPHALDGFRFSPSYRRWPRGRTKVLKRNSADIGATNVEADARAAMSSRRVGQCGL